MKRIGFIIVVVLAFALLANVKINAAPNCDNFMCNPSSSWMENYVATFSDPNCPNCSYVLTHDARIIQCGDHLELQLSIKKIEASSGCYNCYSIGQMFNNAMNLFRVWLQETNYYPRMDIRTYRFIYQSCWCCQYEPLLNVYYIIPCETVACCVTIFDSEIDELGNVVLFNPVLIEPTFEDCNSIIDIHGTCSTMCGVFDPWTGPFGKKSIYNNRTLFITKPEISPNPSKDYVDVYTSLSEKGLVTLNVYDQLGNLLIKDVKYSDQEFKFTINTSNLVNGTYFISLLLNGKIISTGDQFIINR